MFIDLGLSWAILAPSENLEKKGPRGRRFLGAKIGTFLVIVGVIFWTTFLSLFGPLLGPILGPILGPDRPKRGQDEPKRAIKTFKEPKSCIFKNLKKPSVFLGFWVQRLPKRASRGPRRLPRSTQRAPKPQKKGIQKGTQKLTIFGPILGSFWSPFWDPKLLQK